MAGNIRAGGRRGAEDNTLMVGSGVRVGETQQCSGWVLNAISGSDCSYFSLAPVHYDSYLQTRVTPSPVSGHSAYCSAALRPRPWVPPGSRAAEQAAAHL